MFKVKSLIKLLKLLDNHEIWQQYEGGDPHRLSTTVIKSRYTIDELEKKIKDEVLSFKPKK